MKLSHCAYEDVVPEGSQDNVISFVFKLQPVVEDSPAPPIAYLR